MTPLHRNITFLSNLIIDLLEYEQKLKKTGEYLSLEKELLKYQSQISDHFRWEQKNNFIEAMVDFLEDMLDLDQYIARFHEIDSQIEETKGKLKSDFEKLRAFEPDPRSKGFAILIENLFSSFGIDQVHFTLKRCENLSMVN